jgi:hypothetical protein
VGTCFPPIPLLSFNDKQPQLWSNVSIWPNGWLPLDGEDVLIPPGRWVLLDIPASPLLRW